MMGGRRKKKFSAHTQTISTFETEDRFINFFCNEHIWIFMLVVDVQE